MEKNYPKYINFENEICLPLPGAAELSTLYCFTVEGDYDALMNICDTRLNINPVKQNKKYFPMSDDLIFIASEFSKGVMDDPEYHKKGVLVEKGFQVFMRVVECIQNNSGDWIAQRMLLFCPYIIVDNALSIISGREQLGFPKAFGTFQIPSTPEFAEQFIVNVLGYQNFNQNQVQAEYNWVKIFKDQGSDSTVEKKWENAIDAWKDLKELFTIDKPKDGKGPKYGWKFLWDEIMDVLDGDLPMVFLKQFRDIEDSNNACYQAIVEGPASFSDFAGGWKMPGTYTMTVNDIDSFPMAKNLGIKASNEIKLAFWIKGSLGFGLGKEIFVNS